VNQASKRRKNGGEEKKRKEKNSNQPFPYPAFLSVRSVSLAIHLAFSNSLNIHAVKSQ